MPSHPNNSAQFRFYAELNDFLPAEKRQRTFDYHFGEYPGIKDPIEALGVPHTEVDLLLVNGRSVGFDYRLQPGDRVSAYPVFECFDVQAVVKLRDAPLRSVRFVLDVHLGKLARLLRLLGFDCLYRNDYDDPELVQISARESRVLLTRDRRLLFHRAITHGYFVRSDQPFVQIEEVIRRFQLEGNLKPFYRCLDCNDLIEPVAKQEIESELLPKTRYYYNEFYRCRGCRKLYWKGPHVAHMNDKLNKLLERLSPKSITDV